MKIIITESQFEDAVIRYVKKSFKNEIVYMIFVLKNYPELN